MSPPKLLLVMTGSTFDEIRSDHGDFDQWFAQSLNGVAELEVVQAHRGQKLHHRPDAVQGVIVTGSPLRVGDWEPWMEDVADFLRACAEIDTPVLGVCFGHQLLGMALGGKVGPNPTGREIGTVDVVLTLAGSTDPVLGPLVPSFRAQATHLDSVVEPPPGAEILARTAQENCAAMRMGRNVYGVQFHPELGQHLMRRYISLRSKVIDSERGPGAADKLYASVQETRAGDVVLHRFVQEVVIPHGRKLEAGGPAKHSAAPAEAASKVAAAPAPVDGTYQEAFTNAADGTRLFYNSVGQGEPALLLLDGVGCDQYIWKYVADEARRNHRVLRFNYPGHGRSQTPVGWPNAPAGRMSPESLADDAAAVLEHAGVKNAVVAGHSLGVQVALEMWHRHRSLVRGLALVCGSYAHPLSTFHGTNMMERVLPFVRAGLRAAPRLSRTVWRTLLGSELAFQVALRTEVNGDLVRRADFEPYFRHMSGLDPLIFLEMSLAANAHSADAYLQQIDVPTLVVAADHDAFTPPHLSERMHQHIPHSEILRMPGASHAAPLEIPELLVLRLEKFLSQHVRAPKRVKGNGAPAAVGW